MIIHLVIFTKSLQTLNCWILFWGYGTYRLCHSNVDCIAFFFCFSFFCFNLARFWAIRCFCRFRFSTFFFSSSIAFSRSRSICFCRSLSSISCSSSHNHCNHHYSHHDHPCTECIWFREHSQNIISTKYEIYQFFKAEIPRNVTFSDFLGRNEMINDSMKWIL